jgi:hypothetical protein
VNFKATLFGQSEDGDRFTVWQGEVEAVSEDAACEKVIEDQWDDRLRGASCSPVVVLDEAEN